MSTTEYLDITREHCPMTFVKTKLKLESLPKDSLLRVRLSAGEPLENVPRTVTEQGHQVLDITQISETVYDVTIQKG